MPRPTKEQLRKINKLAQTELDEDQVYVFRSLSADTLPVERWGWFGKYHIIMDSHMLKALKKDYKKGVGLLASHDNGRLPFGRTFDAHIQVDEVDGEPVETLYIDHYIVTHVKDEEGNKRPLRTEINGMTTQDIVNHIEVGHTFDTSIGISITEPICSICKNDLRDHEKCKHIPGMYYDVQVGDKTEKQRCDVIAHNGEGIENSLVYAGAVRRAIISNQSLSAEKLSEDVQGSVNNGEVTLYNVDDIKTVPLHSPILCRMSKGQMELFTTTSERKNIDYLKGSEDMSADNKTVELSAVTAELKDVVSKAEYDAKVAEVEQLSNKISVLETEKAEFETKIADLEERLAKAEAQIDELSAKAELADKFTKELVEDVVKAGIQARGNNFNAERYRKYAETLSVDELKEELQAFRNEFSGAIEQARVTSMEIEEEYGEDTEGMTKYELRQLAAEKAMERYRREGGNLEELTKQEFAKLLEKHGE